MNGAVGVFVTSQVKEYPNIYSWAQSLELLQMVSFHLCAFKHLWANCTSSLLRGPKRDSRREVTNFLCFNYKFNIVPEELSCQNERRDYRAVVEELGTWWTGF